MTGMAFNCCKKTKTIKGLHNSSTHTKFYNFAKPGKKCSESRSYKSQRLRHMKGFSYKYSSDFFSYCRRDMASYDLALEFDLKKINFIDLD